MTINCKLFKLAFSNQIFPYNWFSNDDAFLLLTPTTTSGPIRFLDWPTSFLHIGESCNTWHSSHLQTLFQGKRISEFRANQIQGFFCFNLVLAFISPSGECPCPWPTCPQAWCPARFSVYLPENRACPVTPPTSLNFLVPKLYIYLNPPTLAW